MPLSFATEKIISLDQAARLFPPNRNGRPVSLSCVFRWIVDGVTTPSGKVRLEGERIGRRWLTSVEAVERFAAAQTPNLAVNVPPPPRPTTARQRAAEKAARELQKLGI